MGPERGAGAAEIELNARVYPGSRADNLSGALNLWRAGELAEGA